jgi:serine/threonine-protein kinase
MSRPPAPDAIESTQMRAAVKGGKLPRQLPLPQRAEFGVHYPSVEQVYKDRQAILRRYDRMSPEIRKDLADIHETVDGLYNRAMDLARTLHLMDTDIRGEGGLAQVEQRLAALQADAAGGEQHARQIDLLERQKKTLGDIMARRGQVAGHLESCVLAMQNLRLDLLKLTSSNVSEVMGDITHATQQARALSRNVDHAIAAAAEIREAMK